MGGFISFIRRGAPWSVAEEVEVGGVAEDAVALLAGDFLKNVKFSEAGDEAVGGGVGDAEELLDLGHVEDGALVEVLEDAVAVTGGAAETVGNLAAVLLPQGEDAAGGFGRFLAHTEDAVDEELQPALPVARIADGLKALVILAAVLFEVVGKVEDGLMQDFLFAEKKGDEKPPHPPVAVEKGVDGLKLHMGKADLDQGWQIDRMVEKVFESTQGLGYFVGRGRNEGGFAQGAAAGSDPVLAAAQFAGGQLRTAHPP